MKLSILVWASLAAMCTSTFAAGGLKINTMWAASAPDVPSELQVACVNSKTQQARKTCPVIRYQGITTWVFSYKDNRTSLAVVSYDGDGKVNPLDKPDDAIGSSAKYLVNRGKYRRGEHWGYEVRAGGRG